MTIKKAVHEHCFFTRLISTLALLHHELVTTRCGSLFGASGFDAQRITHDKEQIGLIE